MVEFLPHMHDALCSILHCKRKKKKVKPSWVALTKVSYQALVHLLSIGLDFSNLKSSDEIRTFT